jgi:hypothetical protein
VKNIITSLAVMEALGMSCTEYYETGERIYEIESRKVPVYREIKDFYACVSDNSCHGLESIQVCKLHEVIRRSTGESLFFPSSRSSE